MEMQQPELADKVKSIPYFEQAVQQNTENLPNEIHLTLGKAYLLAENTYGALDSFRNFPEETDEKKRLMLPHDAHELML